MKTKFLRWIATAVLSAAAIGATITQTQQLDFGDAAVNYGTVLSQNGPRHARLAGFQLGSAWDAETDAQASSLANSGDDNNPASGPDDEDGVRFLTILAPGQPATVEIVASQVGRIDAFLDFDRDLSFLDPEDYFLKSIAVAAGTNRIDFIVPPNAVAGATAARFRLSKAGGLTHLGLAPDGEVEDHSATIVQLLDFGDAPDSYSTTLAKNGARHQRDDGLNLGNFSDGELNGVPSVNADGDDLSSSINDDDGVRFLTPFSPGLTASVRITASGGGFIDAWFDFGANGTWADAGDQIFKKAPVSQGQTTLSFFVPENAKLGDTYTRFRLSKLGGLNFDGLAPDGEVEDYKVTVAEAFDFGDAPNEFSTKLPNGARHVAKDGFYLGRAVDTETDGQPTGAANGDDSTILGVDDDDGVILLTTLAQGQPASIAVLASAPGKLDAWIDFNNNRSWADSIDRIFTGVNLAAGSNRLVFNVPITAAVGDVYARFRFSKEGVQSFDGPAPNGEVEDYLFTITANTQRDWGDAPAPFPTTLANNGARHLINPNIKLGSRIDAEPDGQPGANADGDDKNPASASNDEDGVAFATSLVPGQPATITVTATLTGFASALLNGWIDFNRSGDWNQTGERIFTNRTVVNGVNTLTFTVPSTASNGVTVARFRLSSATLTAPTGEAPDGEVEDYAVEIGSTTTTVTEVDFGDAPSKYSVTIAQNGAAHRIEPGFFLGARVDGETNGKPSANADGDDTSPVGGLDDEDGVVFVGSFIPGQSVTAQVTASQAGKLDAWIDWNEDGTWSASEQIFASRSLNAGLNSLNFTVPSAARIGTTFARFRLSHSGGLPPTTSFEVASGAVNADALPAGEVEDYPITVDEAVGAGLVDFGDAPNTAPYSYPTLRSEDGARHITLALAQNQPFVMLGAKVDLEADGQPSTGATGDDTNDTNLAAPADEDDEDGVTFTSSLKPGQQATVRVVVASFAIEFRWLNAWIDFDGDGTWNQANEKIFSAREVQNGINNLTFNVPANAKPGTTYARFRITGGNSPIPALSNIGFTGLMPIGEVEDYRVEIEAGETGTADFGDAPNDATHTYPVTLVNNGARHQNPTGVFLGTRVDRENDGVPSSDALGDDNNLAQDDEDGVQFRGQLVPGQKAKVDVTVTLTGFQRAFLHAWVDFNRDGTWTQANERIFSALPVNAGLNQLEFDVPANAVAGQTYARFRVTGGTTVPGTQISFDGSVNDGEVEDYAIGIRRVPTGGPCEGDNKGTDFWLTFPGNYAPDPANPVKARLRIVGSNGVTGTVEIPGLAFTQAYTIGASGFAAVLMPNNAELGNANDVIENKGIHVTASAAVAVYGINQVDYTSDGYLGYPTAALGSNYLVQAYGNVHSGIPELNGTQFAIVACESNTVVTITPKASTTARAANVPYNITLQRGQTYQLRCTDDAPADLSGTSIASTKAIAVFGSHRVANVQSEDVFFADHLVEQMLATTRGGLEFVTAPLATRRGDTFRFFATENNTEITVGSNAPVIRNRGEFIEQVLTAGTRILATKPILAQQYANSSDYDSVANADPFMLTLAHTGQFLVEYLIVTAGSEFLTHYANVVIPSSAKGTLLLDGAASGATFTDVTGSGHSYAQIPLTAGTHTLSAAVPFGVNVYGWNLYVSYGWPGGISFGDNTPPTVTCPSQKITITATGLDNIPCITRVPDYRNRVTVTDNCQLPLDVIVTQTPAPNSIVRAGVYQLVFEARDAQGNLGRCTTPFEVLGTSAPFAINCPDDITVPCENLQGAHVSFTVTAGANCLTDVPVTSTPSSGSLFPVGITRVTCEATNPANGQRATCSFFVRVTCGITPPPPPQQELRVGARNTDGSIDIEIDVDGVLETTDDLGRSWREIAIEPPPVAAPQSFGDDPIDLSSTGKRRHHIRPTGERGFFRIRKR